MLTFALPIISTLLSGILFKLLRIQSTPHHGRSRGFRCNRKMVNELFADIFKHTYNMQDDTERRGAKGTSFVGFPILKNTSGRAGKPSARCKGSATSSNSTGAPNQLVP